MNKKLVLYYSLEGHTKKVAEIIASRPLHKVNFFIFFTFVLFLKKIMVNLMYLCAILTSFI